MEAAHISSPLKHEKGGWTSFPFIIGAVMGLTLASGGWSANLIVFLISEYNIKSIAATQINNVILGCNNLFPIAGAIIADSFFGSFSVVAVFAFISLLGVILLTLTSTIHSLRPPLCAVGSYACQTPSHLQYGVLYRALSLASLGVGGTRFTIATMGADQFDQPNHQAIFFNWYFLTLYLGSIISYTAIIYIQDNISWSLGFGICVIANAISLAVFLLGKRFYRPSKPKGSPFMSIARVVVAAIRKRKMLSGNCQGLDYYHGDTSTKFQVRTPTENFRFLNFAAIRTEDENQPSWKLCTLEELEDLKILIKIMPLWSTSIFLSTTIAIFNSLTILQALTMDRHLGPHFKVPPGSFLVFNLVATALSIFIIDRFLLPAWKNLICQTLTPLQRIGIGHVINILAMVASALIESRRLHVVETHNSNGTPGSSIVPMSGLWLVLPLAIVGVGEGFHFPGQVALYYQEFPSSLRSTSTAMISLLIGIGFYLGTAITNLVRRSTGWLPNNNINDGRLDNVFWLSAVIGVVNFGYYLVCAKLFKYQNVEKHDDHDHGEVSSIAH
ncbi:hypothetical protein P3X46_025430 [Hevea brasiliensis]|uniref:Uncharacterized protein n=1 Tax=Hevea brasiliensis TaxID=3981 RepID=A0ABQ9L5J0_HEVBR|nr:protein NRT1/ PTR FAMILY 2.7 [Hevea brasiliensis]KAJ9159985.1 hypothetical protein P3X46_025430 [Hevea brasiliensis]